MALCLKLLALAMYILCIFHVYFMLFVHHFPCWLCEKLVDAKADSSGIWALDLNQESDIQYKNKRQSFAK